MLQGLQAKFGQSDDLSKMLNESGQLVLVEANPFDFGLGNRYFCV